MHFPREQKSQHPLIWNDDEIVFRSNNPKVHISQWYYCFSVLIKIWAYLLSSIHVRGRRKIREKKDDSEHFCKTSLAVYWAYWERISFMEAGEFLRQVKLIILYFYSYHKAGYGLQRVTNHNRLSLLLLRENQNETLYLF